MNFRSIQLHCSALIFTFILYPLYFPSCPAEDLSAHIILRNGVPQLAINSQPVRPRIFFGVPGYGSIQADSNWKQVAFEFRSIADATNGTMHFRFGQKPGDVFIDDVRIVDLETGADVLPVCRFEDVTDNFARDWSSWPVGPQNTVGTISVEPSIGLNGSSGLHVQLKTPSDGKWPDFHIYTQPRMHLTRDRRYRVTFSVRAEPSRKLVAALYRPGTTFVPLGGPPGAFENQIRLALAAGVNLVSFPIDAPWPAPGIAADWTAVDAVCQEVLDANPKALLLPRIGMDPPEWWRQAHSADVMKRENGAVGEGAVVASPQYQVDAAAQLTAVIRHLENRFGEHIIGYHPCGQNTGEWFYHQAWGNLLNGYAPADLAAWRAWLRERYGSDQKLQAAWHANQVTIESALIPSSAERHASPAGVFRDPATEQHLIDWAEFQQNSMADCICTLARAAHQASAGRKLAVFFYGYVFEFGTLPTGPAVSGHYALRRVLNCPDVDVLCSPISYFDRGLGQNAPSMTAAESVELAGKLWLNEDDTHTFLASEDYPGYTDHVTTLWETNEELLRNAAQESLRNFATWWMDLGGTGWFNDPGFWTVLTQLQTFDNNLLANPQPFRPEIAAIVDERSMWSVTPSGTRVTRANIYQARSAFGRMGAPWGQYLLDDVMAGRVDAKLLVFLNAWTLSNSERNALLSATRGRTRVWCYAPGFFDTNGPSLDSMSKLTGFKLKQIAPAKAWATPTEHGHHLGLNQSFGVADTISPLFTIADAQPDEILATYPDGSPAIAIRSLPSGPSLFVGVPGLTSELLRAAARQAGAHLFVESDCNVYANGPYLALHASQDGVVQIKTGTSSEVIDLISQKSIGHGPTLSIPMKRGETQVLRH